MPEEKDKYTVGYSYVWNGWCVYEELGKGLERFIVGRPFHHKIRAEKKCEKLNEKSRS